MCCFETKNKTSTTKSNEEDKKKAFQLHPRFLVDCDDYYLKDVSNNRFYDACLLAGKTKGDYCSHYIVYKNDNNMKKIKKFLEENKTNFTKTNFTGTALKFLLLKKGWTPIKAIVPVDIDNLNKDERFQCGIFIKPKNVNILGDKKGVDCGMDSCKLHLDYLHENVFGIHDLQSWQTKIRYVNGRVKVGGRNCHLLRMYAWTMVVPMLINLLFSGVVFYDDLISGRSNKFELPFLLLFLYPQWRAFKILLRYLDHKDEDDLVRSLNENEKEVSYIEPFCESGLQVK